MTCLIASYNEEIYWSEVFEITRPLVEAVNKLDNAFSDIFTKAATGAILTLGLWVYEHKNLFAAKLEEVK